MRLLDKRSSLTVEHVEFCLVCPLEEALNKLHRKDESVQTKVVKARAEAVSGGESSSENRTSGSVASLSITNHFDPDCFGRIKSLFFNYHEA